MSVNINSGNLETPDSETPQIAMRELSSLAPYENNPRVNDHAVEDMRRLIHEYGFRVPMLVRGDEIVDGHLRYKAALSEGLHRVPVIDVGDMDDSRLRALRIAINKSADWADWNPVALSEEFDAIAEAGISLDLTGFTDETEIDKIVADAFKAQETGELESEGLGDADPPPSDEAPKAAETTAYKKGHDADAGLPADPAHVSVTFTMSADSRDHVLDVVNKVRVSKGLMTNGQALVVMVASFDESFG